MKNDPTTSHPFKILIEKLQAHFEITRPLLYQRWYQNSS